MNATSLLEVLNVPVAVAASPAQVPAQPVQAFKDSLVVALQASLDASTVQQAPTDAGLQPKAVAADPKLPVSKAAVTDVPSLLIPQPVSVPGPPSAQPVEQPSLLQTVVAQVKVVQSAQTAPAASPAALVAVTKPTVVRPVAGNPRSRPSSQLLPAASILTVPTQVPAQAIADLNVPQSKTEVPISALNPIASAVPANTSTTASSPSVKAVPIPTPDTEASPSVKVVPTLIPDKAASLAVDVAPTSSLNKATNSVNPATAPTPAIVPQPKASTPSALSSTPQAAFANPQPQAVAANVPSVPAAEIPIADASTTAAPLPIVAPDVPLPTVIEPRSVVAPPIAPATVTKPALGTVTQAAPDATTRLAPVPVTNVAKATPSPAVPRTDASVPTAPAPTVHDAVPATREAAPKSSAVPTIQVKPSAAIPSADTVTSAPAAPAAPLVAPLQLPLVTAQTTAPTVLPANSKDGLVKAVSDTAGLKQHVPAVADQDGVQPASQATSQPGDQSQGGAPQQGQSTPPAPANFVNHTIAANAQSASVAVPIQNAAPLAAPAGHAVKASEPAATPSPATSALPQPLPVVNTARLIQTAGQSEMRVGMRSNDFGNISISTSTTRDVISAQISLDHSELAKTLAAHVPEMQAKLGGNQAMEVRIDMNGQATAQGGATSSGTSTASGDGSRGEHQPRGNAGTAQQNERVNVTATAAVPLAEAALNSRLDIRA